MQSFILPLCQAHLFLFRIQMSLVCSIRLPGEAHLWWADGLYRSPAANHSAQRPPGADGSRFLTSFLISTRTPWALIHESCSDIRLIYAALISLTLRGVWRSRDETGILMFDANLSRWFHWKSTGKVMCGRSKETIARTWRYFCCVSCFASLKRFRPVKWLKCKLMSVQWVWHQDHSCGKLQNKSARCNYLAGLE